MFCFFFIFVYFLTISELWHCWLGVWKSIWPVKLSDEVLVWLSVWSECRLFVYGPADATVIPKPRHLLPHLNPDWFYLYGAGLPRFFSGKEAVKQV